MSISLTEHRRIVEALTTSHRAQEGKLQMQLITYREALEDAGLVPPDKSGEDLLAMWRDAAAVIATASEFVHHLGTSRELLDQEWIGAKQRDPWSKPFATRWHPEKVA